MANCNCARPLADVQWNFETLLLIARARKARVHCSIELRNGIAVFRDVADHTRARSPRPFIVQWNSATLLPIACARDPMADVRRYSAVTCRTFERPLAMFNEILQLCCQSHAREALGHVQWNFATLLPVTRARGPWPMIDRTLRFGCLSFVGWLAGEVACT
jgi:hypothetical protein